VAVKAGCLEGVDHGDLTDKTRVAHSWTRFAVVGVPEGIQRWEERDEAATEGGLQKCCRLLDGGNQGRHFKPVLAAMQ